MKWDDSVQFMKSDRKIVPILFDSDEKYENRRSKRWKSVVFSYPKTFKTTAMKFEDPKISGL